MSSLRSAIRAVPAGFRRLAALGLIALCLPATAAAETLPDFDARAKADPANPPGASATDRAQARLRRDLGDYGVVAPAPHSEAPAVVARLDGYLTGPSDSDPSDIALGFVRDHTEALGADTRALGQLEEVRRYRTPDGVTHLQWAQSVGGIPLLDDQLAANVARDGRLINVIGGPRAGVEKAAEPGLGPRAALAAALDELGEDRTAARATDGPDGPTDLTEFGDLEHAELTLFGDGSGARPAWRVQAQGPGDLAYDVVIDATSGELLRRSPLSADANFVNVHENYPGAPAGGSQHQVDVSGYLFNPNTSPYLDGPFAYVWADFNDNDVDDIGFPNCINECIAPSNGSAPFSWSYTYTPLDVPGGNCHPVSGCSWDPNGPPFPGNAWFSTNMYEAGAQAFYFANRFHDHLAGDPGIAFTANAGGFEGNDPVFVQINDGANGPGNLPDLDHLNNANMTPNADGTKGKMQMYLFAPIPSLPNVRTFNGADAAPIVYHEYTHGLSGRTITDGNHVPAVFGNNQSGALSEGWSDWYAMDFLVAQGFEQDTSSEGEVQPSRFDQSGLRTEGIDCKVGGSCPGTANAGSGGYTFGDVGRIFGGGPEVHADGEMWTQTLWDLRDKFGSSLARNLITGGMRLTPPFPTYVQARDGILQQAQNVGGRAMFESAFRVFAVRGLGLNASTASNVDLGVEDFSAPPLISCGGEEATFIGSKGKNTFRGGAENDAIVGLAGNDKLSGGAGDDKICGSKGNDRLSGGGGKDRLIGGSGRDRCAGGGAKDRASGCERKSSL